MPLDADRRHFLTHVATLTSSVTMVPNLLWAQLKDGTIVVTSAMVKQSAVIAGLADREIRSGKYRGPLHGLPWGCKDLIAVPGYPTQWGSALFNVDFQKVELLEFSIVPVPANAHALIAAAVASRKRWDADDTLVLDLAPDQEPTIAIDAGSTAPRGRRKPRAIGLATDYYRTLIALSSKSDGSRPELQRAQSYVARQ